MESHHGHQGSLGVAGPAWPAESEGSVQGVDPAPCGHWLSRPCKTKAAASALGLASGQQSRPTGKNGGFTGAKVGRHGEMASSSH